MNQLSPTTTALQKQALKILMFRRGFARWEIIDDLVETKGIEYCERLLNGSAKK